MSSLAISTIPVEPSVAHATPFSTAWPAVIEHIGEPAFVPALLQLCHDLAAASDVAVFLLQDQVPTLVGAVSLRGDAAQRSGRRYLLEHYYRQDGNLHIARAPAHQLCLSHVLAAQISDAGYRSACYDSAGLQERVSLLIPCGERWVFVNTYRQQQCTLPLDAAVNGLRAHAPALAAATRRHLALVAAMPPVHNEPADPLAALSRREREVVEQILAGRSAKEAGKLLGLSPTSVATYRQRAFDKLGVRRQVELFQRLHGVPAGRA
ncbi:helix-turn-helix transcriptional regulator [Aquabacterium sp.]|uniref:helix-turn-helix transcriptional regulator n=1 Tax=Aquabacterium sp. TaxID=1872578 RepID=UPI002BDDAED6|nr:helix-turn-helix transcriptional regulator [Aquabacterium sp.]HSW07324.1 helix-turn-helix transcriptional regulator [Aquabacterium sp.]